MGLNPVALYSTLQLDLEPFANDGSTQSAAVETLKSTFLKKCRDAEDPEAEQRTVTQFNERRLRSRPLIPDIGVARAFCYRLTSGFSWDDCFEGMRVSSGSAIGSRGRGSSTNGLLKFARQGLTFNSPDSLELLVDLARLYDKPLFSLLQLRLWRDKGVHCTPYCEWITVPKQQDIRRAIALQPLCDAYLQQGIKTFLEDRLRGIGIDISTQQSHNQGLARLGSMGHGLSTIDFSAASDSIGWDILEALFPPDLVAAIRLVTPPSYKMGEVIVSSQSVALSMGNAITFPLETLIFLALGYQAQRLSGVATKINENLAVFGDDVIIDSVSTPLFLDLAQQCGFLPNSKKTFTDGEFRESCGSDWLGGYNVRGVYLKTLRDDQSLLSARNLLAAWSYRHDVSLTGTLNLIDAELERRDLALFVPLSAPGDSGIRRVGGTWRYSPHFQCFTCKVVEWRSQKRRPLPYIFEQFPQNHLQSVLAGWIRDGFLTERPIGEVHRRLRSHYFYNSDDPVASERWLYDKTCQTAGLIWDDESWAS